MKVSLLVLMTVKMTMTAHGEPVEHISSHAALTAVSTLRTFFIQKDSEDVESGPLLNDIENLMENFIRKKQVQTNTLDFISQ